MQQLTTEQAAVNTSPLPPLPETPNRRTTVYLSEDGAPMWSLSMEGLPFAAPMEPMDYPGEIKLHSTRQGPLVRMEPEGTCLLAVCPDKESTDPTSVHQIDLRTGPTVVYPTDKALFPVQYY